MPSDKLQLAKQISEFVGRKIACGETTAGILSVELRRPIVVDVKVVDRKLPPVFYIDGIDLVTEGMLTLGKVFCILKNYNQNFSLRNDSVDQIACILLESDKIFIINGTKINIAHQDPNLPMELEIRRTVVKNIVILLGEKFLKEVDLSYI